MIRKLLAALGLESRDDRAAAKAQAPVAGDLWSVLTEDGGYGVMKVLAVDKLGVHARLYAQRFKERPRAVDGVGLMTEPFKPGELPFSIGHVPLSNVSFQGWEPERITHGTVDEDELEGFRMWQEAQGGYF